MERNETEQALHLLANLLEAEGTGLPDLIVCGGSALQLLGLIDRSTRDVDVLALLNTSESGERKMITSDPLPYEIKRAASLTARALKLPVDWLNAGPADLIRDLPTGVMNRLHARCFGKKTTVYFIDRLDQIMLKTYAAINGGDMRHVQDLIRLTPTDEEMSDAIHWCLRQDASEVFPLIVRSFLEKMGYEHIAKKMDE